MEKDKCPEIPPPRETKRQRRRRRFVRALGAIGDIAKLLVTVLRK